MLTFLAIGPAPRPDFIYLVFVYLFLYMYIGMSAWSIHDDIPVYKNNRERGAGPMTRNVCMIEPCKHFPVL